MSQAQKFKGMENKPQHFWRYYYNPTGYVA